VLYNASSIGKLKGDASIWKWTIKVFLYNWHIYLIKYKYQTSKLEKMSKQRELKKAKGLSKGIVLVKEERYTFDFLVNIADTKELRLRILITDYKIPQEKLITHTVGEHFNVLKIREKLFEVLSPIHSFDIISLQESIQFFLLTTAYALHYQKPFFQHYDEYNPFDIVELMKSNGIVVLTDDSWYTIPFFYTQH